MLFRSILGILLAWSFYQRKFFKPSNVAEALSPITSALEKKLWLDDIYEWFYRGILDGLSYLCGWFDRYIVDGIVNATSWYIKQASSKLREIQTGRIQDYLYGIIAALILLIWLTLGVFPVKDRINEEIVKPKDHIQAPSQYLEGEK